VGVAARSHRALGGARLHDAALGDSGRHPLLARTPHTEGHDRGRHRSSRLAFDWTNHDAILGHGAIIVAAVLWATSILHIRAHRWHSIPFDLVPWAMLLASAILTPTAVVASGAPATEWNGRLVALLLYAGVPGTAVAYWATAVASRNLPAVTTALGLLTTPVVSVAVATLWLGEPLTLPLIASIVLILGGVAIGTTGNRASRD